MAFKDSDKAMGAGVFFRLVDDGDSGVVAFVGEPVPRRGEFRGTPRTQFVFPVVTKDGLQVITVGTRMYVEIRDNWKAYSKAACRIRRVGHKNDQDTKYPIKPCAVPAALKAKIKVVTDADKKQIIASALGGAGGGDDIPF